MVWEDDHVSKFNLEWLRERSFATEHQKKYLDNHYRPQPKLWSKEQFEMKQFDANDLFENNEGTLMRLSVIIPANYR